MRMREWADGYVASGLVLILGDDKAGELNKRLALVFNLVYIKMFK